MCIFDPSKQANNSKNMWYNIKVYKAEPVEIYVSNVRTYSQQSEPFGPITFTITLIEYTDKYCNAWVNMVPAELEAVKTFLKAQDDVLGLHIDQCQKLDDMQKGRTLNVFSKGFNTFEV